MSDWDILLIVTGLLWMVSFIVGIYRLWSEARSIPASRLRRLLTAEAAEAMALPVPSAVRRVIGNLDEEWERRATSSQREPFPTITRLISGRRYALWLQEQLQKAHVSWGLSFIIASLLFGMVFAFTLTSVLITLMFPNIRLFLQLPIALLAASLVPIGLIQWLRFLQGRFLRRVEGVLPDTLSLIANALRAGIGLQQSLEIVAREGLSPLREEFETLNREIALGTPLDEAFQNLLKRVPSAELTLVVIAVLVQREVGGSLAQIFDSAAATIRTRLRLRREFSAITAQARASAFFLAFIIPIFLVISVNLLTRYTTGQFWSAPMMGDQLGYIAFGVAVFLQIGGWCWISRVMRLQE